LQREDSVIWDRVGCRFKSSGVSRVAVRIDHGDGDVVRTRAGVGAAADGSAVPRGRVVVGRVVL
jgi:hypothetical protein